MEIALAKILRDKSGNTGSLLRHEIAFMLGNILPGTNNKKILQELLNAC